MIVLYNIFYIKYIFQFHIYIVQILNTLINKYNLGFSHYLKLPNY